jgi:hypothetical protein
MIDPKPVIFRDDETLSSLSESIALEIYTLNEILFTIPKTTADAKRYE